MGSAHASQPWCRIQSSRSRTWVTIMGDERGCRPGRPQRGSYEQLRVAHLHQIRAALDDHVERVGWPRERIERYRTERLRALLRHARERSPFHAARMRGLRPVDRDRRRPRPAAADDQARGPGRVGRDHHRSPTSPRRRRADPRRADLVLLHARRRAGVQLGRLERGARRVRLGLVAAGDARVPGVADAGRARSAGRRGCAAGRRLAVLEAGRPPARQHPAVRRPDLAPAWRRS